MFNPGSPVISGRTLEPSSLSMVISEVRAW
jgi:hypothetical protein